MLKLPLCNRFMFSCANEVLFPSPSVRHSIGSIKAQSAFVIFSSILRKGVFHYNFPIDILNSWTLCSKPMLLLATCCARHDASVCHAQQPNFRDFFRFESWDEAFLLRYVECRFYCVKSSRRQLQLNFQLAKHSVRYTLNRYTIPIHASFTFKSTQCLSDATWSAWSSSRDLQPAASEYSLPCFSSVKLMHYTKQSVL